MSYNDPYTRQRLDEQPYDPYYSAANQYANYNNSYPPSNTNIVNNDTTNNSSAAWNETERPTTNRYDSNYAPERLSRMGVNEPPKCAHLGLLLRLAALTTKRLGIRANSDYGDTQSMDGSGLKYVDDSRSKSSPSC